MCGGCWTNRCIRALWRLPIFSLGSWRFSRRQLGTRGCANQGICYTAIMDDALDLRGLKCPLPALLAKKALDKCAPGAALTVLADDPMAAVDIPHMCHREGHSC